MDIRGHWQQIDGLYPSRGFCRTLETLTKYQILFVAHRFFGTTITWWETLSYTYDTQGMTWETFENLFREAYFKPHHRWAIADEFKALHQGDMTVTEYYNRFMELSQYCLTGNADSSTLISKFMSRL